MFSASKNARNVLTWQDLLSNPSRFAIKFENALQLNTDLFDKYTGSKKRRIKDVVLAQHFKRNSLFYLKYSILCKR